MGVFVMQPPNMKRWQYWCLVSGVTVQLLLLFMSTLHLVLTFMRSFT